MNNFNEIPAEELNELNKRSAELKKLKGVLRVEGYLTKEVRDSCGENLKGLFPDLEIIGAGSESVVVVDPANTEKVISIGYDTRHFSGVAPFSESRNFHNLVHTLFPENISSLHSVRGILKRDTSRERVFGRPSTADEILDLTDSIKNKLRNLGIDSFDIDYRAADNALVNSGQVKYVDMMDGMSYGVRYIDMKKVKTFYINKFNIQNESLESDEGWKTIIRSVRILKELDIVNNVFNKLTTKSKPEKFLDDMNSPEYENMINSFHFSTENEDEKSRDRIRNWLLYAIKAVQNGHTYDNGQWIT